MAVGNAIENLKDKPHDEKKAVAGGIAITLVIILLVMWGFVFLRKIQKGAAIPTLQGSAVPTDQFDQTLLQQAQNQYQQDQNAQSSGSSQTQTNYSVPAPVDSSQSGGDGFSSQ